MALLGCGGLALAAGPVPPAAAGSQPGPAPSAIAALIGDAECDHTGQCRVVGIGAKPCGGPSGYLAWSEKTTDPSALQAAVQADAEAQKRANRARGLVSDCRVMREPTALCRPRASDGKTTCQLSQGGGRSAI